MVDTTFIVKETIVTADWLNEVNGLLWDVFLGATTAAEAKIALGLVTGTDVQAYDATLTSLAGLGTAADRMVYTTGVDTWAETVITAVGRSILDDATVGDVRTTLGLGTLALESTAPIAQGGTGVTTAQAAIDILTAVSGATDEYVLTKDTASGNALWKSAGSGGAFRGAMAYISSNVSIPNNTNTIVDFAVEQYDTDGIYENVTNPERLTVPTGVTMVRVSAQIVFTSNTTGSRTVDIRLGGTVGYPGRAYQHRLTDASGAHYDQVHTGIVPVVAGQYFSVNVRQDSGAALNVVGSGSASSCWFCMEILE